MPLFCVCCSRFSLSPCEQLPSTTPTCCFSGLTVRLTKGNNERNYRWRAPAAFSASRMRRRGRRIRGSIDVGLDDCTWNGENKCAGRSRSLMRHEHVERTGRSPVVAVAWAVISLCDSLLGGHSGMSKQPGFGLLFLKITNT